jgi:uncharacterized membrane protein
MVAHWWQTLLYWIIWLLAMRVHSRRGVISAMESALAVRFGNRGCSRWSFREIPRHWARLLSVVLPHDEKQVKNTKIKSS